MRFDILLFTLLLIIYSTLVLAKSQVHEYHLPNGLKVLIKEDHRVPIVVTEVWYKVGSSYEPNGITGISHVLEHMMFKGTKRYGPGVFSQIVAENGGEENAFTSSDYTGYYQMLEATKLPISLQLEADRMQNLLIQQAEFTKEIEVVKEERRLRTDDNPQSFALERFLAQANVATPYHHPVIGWMGDLNHLLVSDVQKWYHSWYVPNNAILVIVGDVKPEDTFRLVRKYFAPLKSGVLPDIKQPAEINNIGLRRIMVQTPAKLPLLAMGYNTPVLKTANPRSDAYALEVLQAILDGGDSARLPTTLVRGKQLASNIEVSYDMFSRLDSIFTIAAIPAANHTTFELENAILAEISNLQNHLLGNHELTRAKAQLIANKTYGKDSILNEANEIGALEAVNLSWKEAPEYIDQVKEVTPAQVQAVAKKYLVLDRLTVTTLKPLPLKQNTASQQPTVTTGGQQNVR
jgi:zinc protease